MSPETIPHFTAKNDIELNKQISLKLFELNNIISKLKKDCSGMRSYTTEVDLLSANSLIQEVFDLSQNLNPTHSQIVLRQINKAERLYLSLEIAHKIIELDGHCSIQAILFLRTEIELLLKTALKKKICFIGMSYIFDPLGIDYPSAPNLESKLA